jgi:hypothetical protein
MNNEENEHFIMKTSAKHQIHPIHRDLMIALSMGFAGAMGIVSTVVLIFG